MQTFQKEKFCEVKQNYFRLISILWIFIFMGFSASSANASDWVVTGTETVDGGDNLIYYNVR